MSRNPELPRPHPAVGRLDRLVGRWSMEGNLVGSVEASGYPFTTSRSGSLLCCGPELCGSIASPSGSEDG
jgi:hypothetical protein